MKNNLIWLAILAPLMAIALLFAALAQPAASAGTFTVNSTADATDVNPGDGVCETASGNGVCTLRAAVQETNALAGTDTVMLPAGTYTLTIAGEDDSAEMGDLDINASLNLIGAGQNDTIIDGNALDRLFDVQPTPGGEFSISDLTIQNGLSGDYALPGGAGIRHLAVATTLSLHRVTVRQNETLGWGGGIHSSGFLLIADSRIEQNLGSQVGGGIHSENVAVITNTVIISNEVRYDGAGGGISNKGVLTLMNSTVVGNAALHFDMGSTGGGIANHATGDADVRNSTISHNSAVNGVGGFFNDGTAVLVNLTISHNDGGGVHLFGGMLVVANTTIANNVAAGAGTGGAIHFSDGSLFLTNSIVAASLVGPNCNVPVSSAGHNIDSGNSCGFASTGDMTNTDPMVGPLQNNNGPTWTHALLEGSPAIDAGNNSLCPETDQRGVPRPIDGNSNGVAVCDIGSYEYTVTPILLVNSTEDGTDANPGDGLCETAVGNEICTLRAAIQEANAYWGTDTITLTAGSYTLDIAGEDEDAAATGDLDITSDITLVGEDSSTTIVDGGELDRVFHLLNDSVVAIRGLTIRNGLLPAFDSRGGGIYVASGNLTLANSQITGNMVGESGGGIYNSGSLTISHSAILSNSQPVESEGVGGGIYNAGAMTLLTSTVSYNDSPGDVVLGFGGGIHNQGTMMAQDSTISFNYAERGGGGFTNMGTATLVNVTFGGNDAGINSYDTLAIAGGMLTVTNSTIHLDEVGFGGIALNGGQMIVKNTIITNGATGGGNCYPGGGTLISAGHNLDSGGGCGLNGPGDLTNTDPVLGPLQDNGGPTWTYALLPGSPAIDAGDNNGCPAADQRGVVRPVDGDGDDNAICDMGAFEYVISEPTEWKVYLPIVINQ